MLKYAACGMASVDKYMEELGDKADECVKEVYDYFQAVETVRKSRDEHEVARLVEKYRLMREHVPTWMMKSKEVCDFICLTHILKYRCAIFETNTAVYDCRHLNLTTFTVLVFSHC